MKYQKIGNIAVEADLATELAKYKKSADFAAAASAGQKPVVKPEWKWIDRFFL